jgi:hypothetical protein
MTTESNNRTGDILHDAATDLEPDWPWYADAMRAMHDGLKAIVERGGDEALAAQDVIERAERLAQGG